MFTTLAPEPRDVHWGNVALPFLSIAVRQLLVLLAMIVLLIFWSTPVYFLARFLSFNSIKEWSPTLAKIINKFPALRALVQTSLPSVALITFNAILPYILEGREHCGPRQKRSDILYCHRALRVSRPASEELD